MLTLPEFEEIINFIKEQDKIDSEVSKSLEKISDTWVMINSNNKIYKAMWILLKKQMNDTSDLISWWLYEDVKKEIYDGIKCYNLKTIKNLYQYLRGNLEPIVMSKSAQKRLNIQNEKN